MTSTGFVKDTVFGNPVPPTHALVSIRYRELVMAYLDAAEETFAHAADKGTRYLGKVITEGTRQELEELWP